MNIDDAIRLRAERGTVRGSELIWAAAKRRRRRPHRQLVAAAMVAFVVVAAALVFALAHSGLREATTATTPPTSALPVVGIDDGGGSTCTPSAFCADLRPDDHLTHIRLTLDGATVATFDVEACGLANLGEELNVRSGSSGPQNGLWAGIIPVTPEFRRLPGTDVQQLRVEYRSTTIHFFVARSDSDITDELVSAFSDDRGGWSPLDLTACSPG